MDRIRIARRKKTAIHKGETTRRQERKREKVEETTFYKTTN